MSSELARQKKLLKKRKRREEKRQAARATVEVVPSAFLRQVAAREPLSRLLTDIARPLLDELGCAGTADQWLTVLLLTAWVWNTSARNQTPAAEIRSAEVLRTLKQALAVPPEEFDGMVAMLAERRRASAPDDDRLILDVMTEEREGLVHVTVASAAVGA